MGARKLVTLVVIAIAVALTARYLFWNDRREVRRRVDAIAEAVSAVGNGSVDRAADAARIGRFMTDDVVIRTDASAFVGGRPGVVGFVIDGANTHGHLRISPGDVRIEMIDSSTATVFLTLNISADGPQVFAPAPRQVHGTFVKMGGEWLLSRGEVLRTLEASK